MMIMDKGSKVKRLSIPLLVLRIKALSILGTLVNSCSSLDWEAYSSDVIASILRGFSFSQDMHTFMTHTHWRDKIY
jgi:hypothetical protein